EHIAALSQQRLTFQLGRHNCSTLMQEVIKLVGYEVNTETTLGYCVKEILFPLNQFPLASSVVSKVHSSAQRAVQALPTFIAKPLVWTKDALLYPPNKCGTILMNFAVLALGGAKQIRPHHQRVISHWTDLFKDETSKINHMKFFIDWQKQQESTFVEKI